jgi:hypothetical protein
MHCRNNPSAFKVVFSNKPLVGLRLADSVPSFAIARGYVPSLSIHWRRHPPLGLKGRISFQSLVERMILRFQCGPRLVALQGEFQATAMPYPGHDKLVAFCELQASDSFTSPSGTAVL